MEGGRKRLSWPREEWRRSRQGKKVAKAVAGIRARPSAARSAFGQTSHIEDAGGCARRENTRNETGDRPSASPSNLVAAARHPVPARDKAVNRRTHAHRERAVPCSTSLVETWCPCANRWRRETRHPVTRTQSDCSTQPPPRIVGECRDRSDLAPTDVTDRRVLRRKVGPSASDPEWTASTGTRHEDSDRQRRDGSCK